jgi:hypothetical protein
MFCDLTIRAGHAGQLIVWPTQDKDGNWFSVYDTQGSQAIQIAQLTFAQYESQVKEQQKMLAGVK